MTEKCPAHEELIKTLTVIKTDVEWIKKDREDGPAVIRNNGDEHYYKDGELWQL